MGSTNSSSSGRLTAAAAAEAAALRVDYVICWRKEREGTTFSSAVGETEREREREKA